jgi:toxin YhaV
MLANAGHGVSLDEDIEGEVELMQRPYAVFEKKLGRGNPPDDWDALIASTRSDWSKASPVDP